MKRSSRVFFTLSSSKLSGTTRTHFHGVKGHKVSVVESFEEKRQTRTGPRCDISDRHALVLKVPPEAFRLGRTRVFFRAGQISTLQKILNETSADRAPWIFERLQQALENRHCAKAAADEAQVLLYFTTIIRGTQ